MLYTLIYYPEKGNYEKWCVCSQAHKDIYKNPGWGRFPTSTYWNCKPERGTPVPTNNIGIIYYYDCDPVNSDYLQDDLEILSHRCIQYQGKYHCLNM
ncbi:hypothetical protein IE53DRAFT_372154 [Violaceomyces palustris]|uniref:Uncharacterized protein n=1 Tax=Violaceomyces palustris TaxID=1673888 RepID=A0ACD0NLK6_9BASI|nr:hypothetical protein IE53DRAFT_372154 [Violaceomyces palustris]